MTNNGGFSYTPTNNFVGTDSYTYRATDGITTSGVATVTLAVSNTPVDPPTALNDIYVTAPGTLLNVSAQGVLTNDSGSGSLSAVLVSGPAHGTFSWGGDGSFSYQSTNGFAGVDDFTYVASDGSTTSSVAVVAIEVVPPGKLFLDNFTHSPLWPWVQQTGTWSISNSVLAGTSPADSYGHAYLSNNWSDYLVQAQIRFSDTNAWGGGIGGRMEPVTGSHYGVWVYPEGFSGGATNGTAVMKLIKFHSWNGSDYTNVAQVILTNGVGTNWHTVGLGFQGSNIFAYFDGTNQLINLTDDGALDGQAAFASGGICADMYTVSNFSYTLSYSNVIVTPLVTTPVANNDSYTMLQNTTLNVSAPGVLNNDTGSGSLTALLASGPAHGTLTLTNNGGFRYTPTNSFFGTDSFTYRATDGLTTSGVATVTFNITNNPPAAFNDIYMTAPGTLLNVSAPGVLTNDTGSGNLSAILASGPAHGTFSWGGDGSFSYQPTNGFVGVDDFTYEDYDGSTTSSVAVAAIEVVPAGKLFLDNFTHSPLWPWVQQTGTWSIANNVLSGTSPDDSYGHAYLSNNWSDYLVQAQIRFSDTNAWGGGIGGRMEPVAGSHYGVWVYPEGFGGGVTNGAGLMKVIKFHSWTGTSDYTTVAQVILTNGVGTNWHTIGLAFQGSNIFAYYDRNQVTNLTDDGTLDGQAAFSSGGICADMYTVTNLPYTLSFSNVVVTPLVANDSYTVNGNATLNVPAPGVLANDTNIYGTSLTATLVSGAAHGILNFTNNGGFSYTPTNNFSGTDSFVYRANAGATNLGTATVTITVVPVLTVVANNQSRGYGATNLVFTVSYNGFVNGDGINVLTGSPVVSTTATTNSPVGNYPISVSQGTLNASNYVLAFVNGTLSVTNKLLGVSANSTNRTYGAINPVFTVSYSGFVNGDNAGNLGGSLLVSSAADTNSPVGSYAIVASGLSSTNYAIHYTNGVLGVTNALLTVSANSTNKAYGQLLSFAGTEIGVSGLVSTDYVSSATLASAGAAAGAGAGNYAINVTNAVGDAGLTNYAIKYVPGTLSVGQAGLGVSANSTNRTYGAINPVFTVSYSGFVNGDNAGNLGGSLLVSSAADTNSPVGSYAIVASGLSSTNYAIHYTNGVLGVTNALLTVSANSTNKAYGQLLSFAGTEIGVSGLVSTDYVSSATLASAGAAAGAGAGNYAINVTNAVGDAGLTNYAIKYVPGTLSVGQAGLGVSANSTNRTYGAINPVFTVSYSGFVNGDNAGNLGGSLLVSSAADTNSPVGSYAIVASGLSSTNYAIHYTNGVLGVTNALLTVSANSTNKAYGQLLSFAGTEIGVSGLVSTDYVSSATLASAGAAAGAGAGNYAINVTNAVGDAGLTNYAIKYVPGTLSVGQAGLGVSANSTNRTYGAINPVFTVSYSGFVNGDNAGNLGGSLLVSSAADTNSPVGSYAIVASGLSSTNYAIHYTNGVLGVTNALLTVSANSTNKAYGQLLSFAGTEIGVSGLVSTDYVSSATLASAGAAAGAGAGNYAINVTNAVGDAGLTNYAIKYVPGTLSVGQAGLGVSANSTNRTYGAINPVFTVSYSGFVNGDNAGNLGGSLLVSSAADTNSPVGSYAIVASGLSSTNYAIHYTNGVLGVTNALLTVSANSTNKAYGQLLSFAGTEIGVSGLVSTDYVSSATLASAGAAAGAGAGNYAINVTNAVGDAGLTNYAIKYVPGTLSVGQAGLGVSANSTNRTYGAINPVFTVSYSGFVNGDNAGNLGGSLLVSSAADTNSPVGSYAIVASGLSSTNYAIHYTNGVLGVTNALLTVSANSTNKAYGQLLSFAGTEIGVSGLVSTDYVSSATLASAGAAAGAGAGNYAINVTNAVGDAGLTNYAIKYVPGTLSVGQAGLGVSANSTNRTYGAINPVFTVSYSGFVNGDNAGNLGGSLLVSSAADTNSPVGSYAIVASGLSSTNYAIHYTNGVLGVTNALLTVSANSTNKAYGQLLSFAGTEIGVSGLVSTDYVSSATLASAGAAAGAGAGNYAINVTNAVGDAGLTNYAIKYVPGTLSVGQAGLGVSANSTNRTYGAINPVFTVSYSGFVNGDNAGNLGGSLLVSSAADTNSPVGSYAIVASGLSSTNYAIHYTNGVLGVTNALLTVSANSTNKAYGQLLSFAGTEIGVSGLVSTDYVSSATLASAGAAAGAGAGNYAINVTNAVGDAGLTNYAIKYVPGTLSVGQAGLGVSANSTNRTYGAINPVFTVSYSGFVNGDNAGNLGGSLLVSSAADTNSPVGSYAIVASGLSSTNYAIHYTNGVLGVTNALLTVSANSTNKAYGQLLSFAGTEIGVSGLVSTDYVSSATLASAGAAAGAGAGNYAINVTNAVGDAGLTNYADQYVPGTLSVGQAGLGVSANSTNRTYGAINPVFTVSYSGFVNGDNAGNLGGSLLVSSAADTNSPVGSYAIVASGLSSTNYAIHYTNGVLGVTNALLTVSANSTNKAYGQLLSFAGTEIGVSGLVSTDYVSSATLASAGAAAGAGAGNYAINVTNAVGDAGLTNYADQLCARDVECGPGGTGGQCQQHEPDVWGDQPGVHGELQRLCQRG